MYSLNKHGWLFLVCSVILLCGHVSYGQESATTVTNALALRSAPVEKIPAVVTGLPYSSVTQSESIQTGTDGTQFDRRAEKIKTYRDSQGRTRSERYIAGGLAKDNFAEVVNVTIRDPIAGTEYILNPRTRTARQMTLHLPRQEKTENNGHPDSRVEMKSSDGRPHATAKVDDLGTQVMDGLVVEGKKTTVAFPADFEGNDRAFEVVTERWFSKELEIYILIKTDDPRSGEHRIKTTITGRAEPDPALFEVPADYTITQK
jgi:hypothetical protein